MASLQAKANTGAGTDQLGGENHSDGFVAAVVIRDAAGTTVVPASQATLASIDGDLGAPADAAATDDTGTWSLIALTKRIAGKLSTLGQKAMAASVPVVIASDQSQVPVNQPGVSATGSLAALNAAVSLVMNGNEGFAVDVRGTFVGTITFQATIDGTNWIPLFVTPYGSSSNVGSVQTATAVGGFSGSAAGAVQVRAIMSAFTSGSATITLRAVSTPQWTYSAIVGATLAVSGTVTATVGTSITGGTISPLTVAGSTAEASSAKTVSGASASALTNASGTNAHFFVNITAATGTTPTLVVRVQIQDPVSTNWVDLPGAATASLTANGLTLLTVNNLPRTYRLAWTIGGTTPSFTFSVGIAPVI